MPFHVPFAHRNNSGRPNSLRPVYIGFDEPVSIQNRKREKQRGRFNWSGFWGLLLALISPITFFVIAPLALLLSLNGMRRAPRGMAFVGLVFSVLSTTVLSLMILRVAHEREYRAEQRQAAIVAVQNREKIKETRDTLDAVQDELRAYRVAHSNQLPSLTDGMDIAIKYVDGWEKPIMYIALENACLLRSAGPDGQFDTGDDVAARLEGMPADWTMKSDAALEFDSASNK